MARNHVTFWSGVEAAGSEQAALERSEVPDRHKWDLDRIFPAWSAWEEAFAEVEASLADLQARQSTFERSAEDFLGTIEAIMAVRQKLGVVYTYATLKSDEDTRVGANTSRRGRSGTLAVKFDEATSWFEPALLGMSQESIARFMADKGELKRFSHFIDSILRMRDHTLPAEQESLLASTANIARGARHVFIALNNADLKFPAIRDENGRQVELTKARYSKYVKSPDRRVRKEAFEACLDTYSNVINTLAANLDAHVKSHVFYAQARHYTDTLEASLYPNAVPTRVFQVLLETADENLVTVSRYTALKQKVLGLAPLHEYDLYVPLFAEEEQEYSYEEAQELLLEALAPLGSEYLGVVRKAFAERWIDVHENAGKRSGAYSNGVYGISPYILLNWSGQLRDTFTLAHEMGHSVHTYLSNQSQPYVYSDYPIFTAEVASTCNEMLLLDYLLRRATSRRQKLFLLDYHLTQINDTVFRQTMFADFEQKVHREAEKGETLTAEILGEIYLGQLKKYWGSLVTFDAERSPLNWSRIPHFYYNYYVYQYATAYAAATVLSRRILEKDEKGRLRYLGLLGSGSSDYPIETLQRAGADMTQSRPIEDVYSMFAQLLDEVDRLLDEEES